uniref:nesprin-1 isoform X2 n=1 Tax=Ciona intestinalis TaxID=7719 RepID=UPI00089DC167|nr:nesprin-1 isoform X2 [Ciona intestinalis]|eukprot:XP_018666715.1 nesprin-1 isoform X2 [Ciona intestinalis]
MFTVCFYIFTNMFSPEYYDKQADYIGSLHEALDVAINNGQELPLDPNAALKICGSCKKPQLFLANTNQEPHTPTRHLSFDQSEAGDEVTKPRQGGTYVTAVMNTLLTTRSPNSKYSDSCSSCMNDDDEELMDLNKTLPASFSPNQNFKRRPSMRAERSMLSSSRARKYRGPGFQVSPTRMRPRLHTAASTLSRSALSSYKYLINDEANQHDSVSSINDNKDTSMDDIPGRKNVKKSHEMYYSLSPLLLAGSLSPPSDKISGPETPKGIPIESKITEVITDGEMVDENEPLKLEHLESRKKSSDEISCVSDTSTATSSGAQLEYFSVISKTKKGLSNKTAPRQLEKPQPVDKAISQDSVFSNNADGESTMPRPSHPKIMGIKSMAKSGNTFNVSSVSVTAQRPHSTPICGNVTHNLKPTELTDSMYSQAEPGLLSFSNVFDIGDVNTYDVNAYDVTDEVDTEMVDSDDFMKEGYCNCSFCNNNEDMFASTQADIHGDVKHDPSSFRTPGHHHCKRSDPHLYDPPLLREDLSPTPEEKKQIKISPQYKEVLTLFCQCSFTQDEGLQEDIEKHSTGVASVLNLCEVLLHDADACSTDGDKESITEATKSLDRRWRNICALSMERRLQIEDTQRLWQKFLADFARFSDWLKSCEETASRPCTDHVTYAVARDELRSFENFQRQVHEGLTQLELINKQYRRLARENRTDTSNQLRLMVYEGNTRWDALSRRISCVLRRLKHAIERRELFETLRESLLVWLTEMDLQLTNLEHFSPKIENADKLKQIKVFKKRIDDRISLLINLDERGKLLLQGGEEQDCVKLEEELNDFHEYCLQVFIRLDRYYRRLLRVSDDSEYKNSLYHDMEMQELSWWAGGSSEVLDLPGDSPSPELTSSRKSKKQNGRLTPGSMGSLEWDDYDMSRSEIETKIANGEMTDDDSIPELSPFETRDTTIPVKQSPLSSANTSQQIDKTSKRSNAVDIRDLDTDTRHKKPRTSEKMSETQRQQLNNDLEDVLSWLVNVKCDVTENGDYVTIRDLEQKLSDLKDLQKQIEVRKPIVLSINLVTSPYSTSEEDGDELKTKLRRMNKGWEDVEKSVLDWKRSLQRCFVRSKAFRSDVQKIQERVKDLSRRRDDLVAVVKTWESPLSAPFSTLRKTHRDLVQIRIEILEDRAQVASLQDVSNLLFVDARYRATSSPPVDGAAEACDKLNDLGASLRSLLDRVADDIQVAETALQRERHRARDEVSSTSDVDSIASETSLHSSTPIKLKMLRRKLGKGKF